MNNSILSKVFIFATGAAIGSVVTWKLLEKKINDKYEQMYQDEVAAMKALYEPEQSAKNEPIDDDTCNTESAKVDPEKEAYTDILEKNNYVRYSNPKEKEVASMKKPYVILPEEFGEAGYETVTLTYYDDGVLTYAEDDDVIYEIDEIVGYESLQHFGDYEDDAVHVRNDSLEKDYEVLYDERKYSDLAIE
jgi:hypothetical protein